MGTIQAEFEKRCFHTTLGTKIYKTDIFVGLTKTFQGWSCSSEVCESKLKNKVRLSV